jgi:hypothetical protein
MDYHEDLKNPEIIIVSFGGFAQEIGGIQTFEFLRFLETYFKNSSKLFYKDTHRSCYHYGVKGISTNVDQTLEHIKSKIKGYNKVLFLGVCGGGYAAILFGSLLHVQFVLAFTPPTILYEENKDPRYKNLKNILNNVTEYYVYGNTKGTGIYHISHCDNINVLSNVHLIKREYIDLKQMRDSGELEHILFSILN